MRYFGPYLSGLRVRHAVCVLTRLLPLFLYRGPAGRHGTGPGPRASRRRRRPDGAYQIAHRDSGPPAYRAELGHKLAGAVAGPRSQRPGVRVRLAGPDRDRGAELDQLPQRVTSMDAANLTISGWSAGMLARFPVRDGRLRRWSQQPCSLARQDLP